jgi:hypothetical protein
MFWSRHKVKEEERPQHPRGNPRFSVVGQNITILMDARHHLVRLKDLSACGLCGLTDAPLIAGQQLCFIIEGEPIAGEIRWIRRTLIGARFTEPLDAEIIRKLQSRSKAREAESDGEE